MTLCNQNLPLVNANFGIKEICKPRNKEPCSLFPFQNNIYIVGLIDLFPTATVKILDLNSILFLFYTKRQNVIMFSLSAQEIKNKWFPYLYQNRASKSCNTKDIKFLGNVSRFCFMYSTPIKNKDTSMFDIVTEYNYRAKWSSRF